MTKTMTDLETVRQELDKLWSSVSSIERDVAVVKATSGKIQLTPGVAGLLWTILVAILALSAFVVRLDEQARSNGRQMEKLVGIVEGHVASPGHQMNTAKIGELDRRLDALERRQAR